jgi:hypothetical protein
MHLLSTYIYIICIPEYPGLQAQVLGATHILLAPHAVVHTGVVQSIPTYTWIGYGD